MAFILYSINSCANPIIYAITVPDFKKVMTKLFRRNSLSNEGHGIELTGKTTEVTNTNTKARY